MILVTFSACSNHSSINKTLETKTPQGIRIGLFLPMGHDNQTIKSVAKNYYNAAKLAAEDLRPIPLEIILYETDGTEEEIRVKAREALNDGIHIAIGTLNENDALSLATILRTSNKKLLSFSAYENFLGSDIFHMGIGNINLADQMIQYSINTGYNNFLILEGIHDENSLSLDNLRRLVKEKNGSVLKYIKISETSEHLEGIKTSIEKFRSDSVKGALIILGTPNQNMIFTLASLKELMDESKGARIQLIGLSQWATKNNLLTESALTNAWFPFINKKRISEFSKRYHALYGSKPSLESAIAYDSIAVIGALIKNANEPYRIDPFTNSSITNPSGFLGVLGTFRFLPNGSSERLLGIGESRPGGIKILKNPQNKF